MKGQIKSILAKVGVRNKYDAQRYRQYTKLKESLEQGKSTQEKGAVLLIFSKDRAMQLDALLRSYFHYSKNVISVHILYRASEKKFEQGYEELMSIYKNKQVDFIEEKSFKLDLKGLFERITSSKVIFLVDDLFFKNTVDFKKFTAIDPKKYVASLRMGKHLNFSYTLQKKQKLPVLFIPEEQTDMLSWCFSNAELDWAYPLSVDGHLFDSNELRILVNELEYKAPNSFEEALQVMKPLFNKRKGLCYPESILVNNPCNKVQSENNNISGEMTIEELNAKWLSGYRIDFEKQEGLLNESAHQELTVEFIKR